MRNRQAHLKWVPTHSAGAERPIYPDPGWLIAKGVKVSILPVSRRETVAQSRWRDCCHRTRFPRLTDEQKSPKVGADFREDARQRDLKGRSPRSSGTDRSAGRSRLLSAIGLTLCCRSSHQCAARAATAAEPIAFESCRQALTAHQLAGARRTANRDHAPDDRTAVDVRRNSPDGAHISSNVAPRRNVVDNRSSAALTTAEPGRCVLDRVRLETLSCRFTDRTMPGRLSRRTRPATRSATTAVGECSSITWSAGAKDEPLTHATRYQCHARYSMTTLTLPLKS